MPTSEAPAPPRAVLFDLDGTLVDPAGGITGGIAHGLRDAGLPVPPEATLEELVGPPLALGLRELVGVPESRLDEVISSYRTWYATEGVARSAVYPGITDTLEGLRAAGVATAVTTSKPQGIAERLAAHHGLDALVDLLVGSDDDERAERPADGSKVPQVREALRRLDVPAGRAVVVGDRRFDVEAALAVGTAAIGAGWGFAPAGELAAAGAGLVLERPTELLSVLLGEVAA